jgi:2-desacetyl-2-hydroxyethyl bacteriochlorophyllide A dehydrogenase
LKAVCYLKPGLEVMDVEEPQLARATDVKIRVHYASICGSDVHILKGDFDGAVPAGRPIGHEASGTIVELGQEATIKGLKVGDKVTYYFNDYCGRCFHCRNGEEHFCTANRPNAAAMAEYIVCSEQQTHKLPEKVDLLTGCLAEPVSVCLHGVDLANILPGNNVAIFGAGGIGLILLQLTKLAGATNITLVEPVERKRLIASKLGADHVLDPADRMFAGKVSEITEGRGFQSIIEASGNTGAAESAFEFIGRGGTLVYFSLYPSGYRLPVDMFQLFYKEATLRGVFQSPYVFPRVVSILPKLDLSLLTEKVFDIADAKAAFEEQAKGQYPKIVLKVSA